MVTYVRTTAALPYTRVIWKVVTSAVVTKGAVMAATLVLVLGSHLSEFVTGLIIAIVSATVTGVFTVLAAWITVKVTRPIHADVIDVKHKVEADRREEDKR